MLVAKGSGDEEKMHLLKDNWSRGVTVSTLDSESSDRGSNPRGTFLQSRAGGKRQGGPSRTETHAGARRCSDTSRTKMRASGAAWAAAHVKRSRSEVGHAWHVERRGSLRDVCIHKPALPL